MEAKPKEITKNNQEEIKFLTFQPQQMLNEIEKLNDEISSLKIDKNTLTMFIIDLKEENDRLRHRSIKVRLQEILLRCLGGQWEEGK